MLGPAVHDELNIYRLNKMRAEVNDAPTEDGMRFNGRSPVPYVREFHFEEVLRDAVGSVGGEVRDHEGTRRRAGGVHLSCGRPSFTSPARGGMDNSNITRHSLPNRGSLAGPF